MVDRRSRAFLLGFGARSANHATKVANPKGELKGSAIIVPAGKEAAPSLTSTLNDSGAIAVRCDSGIAQTARQYDSALLVLDNYKGSWWNFGLEGTSSE